MHPHNTHYKKQKQDSCTGDDDDDGGGGGLVEIRFNFCSVACSEDVKKSYGVRNIDHVHLLWAALSRTG